MGSLFVVGNGFDISHRMKTSYEDFHNYLIAEYPQASLDGYTVPESIMMSDGGEEYDDDVVVGFLREIISNAEPKGEQWSDLETSLGLLELHDYFPDWNDHDDDDDENPYHEVYRNQDIATNLAGAVLKITDYFSEWINSINIHDVSPKRDFEKLIDRKKDSFLTFNYTRTLEEVYEVENVCHIHGKQGGELLFGHGNDTNYYDDDMSRNTGSEDSLLELQLKLRKDTTRAIRRHEDFFNHISKSVDKIYSYGFSFSEVDKVYIQEICRRIPTSNVTWYLNDYDIDKIKEFENIIISCGFEGEFDTYHIS